MTENRKPETPGMSEVSAKFEHEGEISPSPDQALSALWQEHERLRQRYVQTIEETDLAFTAKLAITKTGTPEYRAADAAHEAAEQHQQQTSDAVVAIQNRMAKVSAHTVAGTLLKLRVVGIEVTDEFKGRDGVLDETLLGSVERLTLSALADLERLSEGNTAIVPASVTDAIVALRQRWEEVRAERGQLKHRDDAGPKHPDVLEDERLHDVQHDIEDAIANTPTHTAAGIVAKMLQLQRNETEFDGDAPWRPAAFRTALEALANIAASTTKETVIDEPLLALERRWREAMKAFAEATPESPPKPSPDDMTAAISDAQEEMAVTPAQTIAGVLVKLRVYADLNAKPSNGVVMSIDQLPFVDLELDEALVRGVIHDLERLAPTTTVAEIPPAEDTALFDVLAEYDRLMAISQGLEHRTKIFRPGIPEAKEADEAYEAAYDETSTAWKTARSTPATTQAGLFAKLQATVRFMDDCEQDELWEVEWHAIKADVQRIGGEARP